MPNFPRELLMGLLNNTKLPMKASPELERYLQSASTRAQAPLPGPGSNPPISKDPWFDTPNPPVESTTPATPQEYFIWQTNEEGQQARLDGPYASPDEAQSALQEFPAPKNSRLEIGPSSGPEAQVDPLYRKTLVKDMMRATSVQPGRGWKEYFDTLKDVPEPFVKRIAQQLELNSDLDMNTLRGLIATEFEHYQ